MPEGSTPSNSPSGWPARDPFIIVGVPRSGTTMLRLMLNSHPRLRGAVRVAVPRPGAGGFPLFQLVRSSALAPAAGRLRRGFVRAQGRADHAQGEDPRVRDSRLRQPGARNRRGRRGRTWQATLRHQDVLLRVPHRRDTAALSPRGSSISCATAAGSLRRIASSPGAHANATRRGDVAVGRNDGPKVVERRSAPTITSCATKIS